MKSTFSLVFAFVLLTNISYGQNSNFERGYKEGFAKGYCYNQPITCIGKAPAFAPIPKINESSNSYHDGYNKGFSDGLDYKRSEISSGSSKHGQEIKFNEYISQIPTNGLSILAYKEKLYSERKEWIENIMAEIHNLLTTKFVYLDAEEGKKWYDEILNFQNSVLYDNGKGRDLSENSIFNPLKSYLTRFTNSLIEGYSSMKNDADANTINYDESKYENLLKESWVDVEFYPNRYGKSAYTIWKQPTFEFSKFKPDFITTLNVVRNAKSTTLNIIYYKHSDSYYFYFADSITTRKNQTKDGSKEFAMAYEYRKGGHGNPIFIKLSDSTCVIFDRGTQVSANFLGIVRFKMNLYDSTGKLIESSYQKRKCWQDKVSGKKYFQNRGYLKDEEIFKDELLLTSNLY